MIFKNITTNQVIPIKQRKCNTANSHLDTHKVDYFNTNNKLSVNSATLLIGQKWLFKSIFLLSISNFMVTIITMEAKSIVVMGQQNVPHVIAIKEGADLDLSCPIVVQNEDMIISWTCDDEPANIRSSRIHVTESGKLRIKSAKVGDACNYRCEAADGFGTLSMIVKVIVVDKRFRDKLARTQNNTLSSSSGRSQKPSGDDGMKSEDSGDSSNAAMANLDHLKRGVINRPPRPQQAPQADLEVQVEPANLYVELNRTFSLECKVKHPPHLMVPQIIWLKEFIGPEPNSISEAHEQNLVIIDDVYYHGLNWPRSVSYSKQSACVNSALLVRQSNFVHSGRYICFAGYPPSIMSGFNMSSISSPQSDDNGNPSSSATTTTTMKQPLKYKMALAIVRVGNLNGEIGKQKQPQQSELRLVSALTTAPLPISEKRPKNLLISIFSTDSWMRNLAACLTLFCGLIIGIKLIYTRCKLNNNATNDGNNSNNCGFSGGNSVGSSKNNNKTEHALDEACFSISGTNSTDTPITQQQQFHLNGQPHQYHQASNISTTIHTSTSGINSTDCSQILTGASRQLEEKLLGLPQLDDESSDSDHLYSEISERDKMISREN